MGFQKKTVRDIDVANRRVLLRCDLNVPLNDQGVITDDSRIRMSVETIEYLLSRKAKVIVCSHLGRPKGVDPSLSLLPVARHLGQLLSREVPLAKDVVGPDAKALAQGLLPGGIMMLENVRFEPGEEQNDPALSREFASLADIFVNDAFGACHRAHCSVSGVSDFLPAVCGFLIEREITVLGNILQSPDRPFTAILGGSKIKDKIKLIRSLIGQCDHILIGGGMAYTFDLALGGQIGGSIKDESRVPDALSMIEEAKNAGVSLMLPVDAVCAKEAAAGQEPICVKSGEIPEGYIGLDIGPLTAQAFGEVIKSSKTVFWNGPAGMFEIDDFAKGSEAIARALAESPAVTVVGGGDSAAVLEKFNLKDRVTHVSTGGGASLEFLEGRPLPGIECLLDKDMEEIAQ